MPEFEYEASRASSEQLVTASSPPRKSRYHTSYAGLISRKSAIDQGKVSTTGIAPRPTDIIQIFNR